MNDAPILMSLDLRKERVRMIQHLEYVAPDPRREGNSKWSRGQELRQVLPLHILHLDVEVAVPISIAEDAGNAIVQAAQPRLQDCSTALRFHDLHPVGVGA